jgi:hypothetical protein
MKPTTCLGTYFMHKNTFIEVYFASDANANDTSMKATQGSSRFPFIFS